jgi:RNA polymerase sigma-70 factor (ECF subfamily)
MKPDSASPTNDAHAAAAVAARTSFGRLVSWLAWQWRDIAAAEDALSEALFKALERWPHEGIPASPDAWLLTVAKRELLQLARHDKVRFDPKVLALLEQQESNGQSPDNAPEVRIPDARLKLLFVCAHPAIDRKIRAALMLQTVLGLQAAEIAPAMLTSPTTLAQRLVRAKQKIRDTRLRFEEPEAAELPQRLHDVLEAIYAAFGLSVDAVDGAEIRVTDLQQEAMFLCSLVVELMPRAAEAQGLLALMFLVQARRKAQFSAQGEFIPLALQDMTLWDRGAILQGDQLLWQAAKFRKPGPFQLEAAIQSAHCHRLFGGSTPWQGIAKLYAQMNQYYPTAGSLVAGAVALAEAGNTALGLAQLTAMDEKLTLNFQPWWVAKAHLLTLQGRDKEAQSTLQTAIGLTTDVRLRRFLEMKKRQSLKL